MSGSVAIRSQSGEDLGTLSLEDAIDLLQQATQAPDTAGRLATHQSLKNRLIATNHTDDIEGAA